MQLAAELMDGLGSHEELKDHPGAMYQYEEVRLDGRKRLADVCCPGCGQGVYAIGTEMYPLTPDGLTCPKSITFACCGQTWKLANGLWTRMVRRRPD